MEPIQLSAHNKNWNAKFQYEKELLSAALAGSIMHIHHVGSTTVPGLLAKPVIDIAVEAEPYPPGNDILDKLAAIGYTNKGESGVSGRTWFIKGTPREFHLHVCAPGSGIIARQIKFRDKLISDEKLRKEYEQLKLANAHSEDIDSKACADAKSELIRLAIAVPL